MATVQMSRPVPRPNPQGLPPSPTLTNPDMILPDYDFGPAIHQKCDRVQSPLDEWQPNGAVSASQSIYGGPYHQFNGLPLGPIAPTTPIIYGNGTMLSDIGEVTEVESTPSRPTPIKGRLPVKNAVSSVASDAASDPAMRSSPTMGDSGAAHALKKKSRGSNTLRERKMSNGSSSTVTNEAPTMFADFDDTMSVGDSLFQGDDEESMASSYVPDSPMRPDGMMARELASKGPRIVHGTTQQYSETALSRKAEHILANAKRRLTTMEDNLTRARSSLHQRSASSASEQAATETPFSLPPLSRSSYGQLPTIPDATTLTRANSKNHGRQASENSLRIGLPVNVYLQPRRSSSSGQVAGQRQSWNTINPEDFHTGQESRLGPSPSTIRDSFGSAMELHDQRGQSSVEDADDKRTSISSSAFGDVSERGMSRPVSAAQVRDLKDQMLDLKGKISSLRQQARADSLRRRSMQSLRTPSPFTHAQVDKWQTGTEATTSDEAEPNLVTKTTQSGEQRVSRIDPEVLANVYEVEQEADETSEITTARIPEPSHLDRQLKSPARLPDISNRISTVSHVAEIGEIDDDLQTENGDAEDLEIVEEREDEEQWHSQDSEADDMMSESGESMYHDTMQHMVSHEDREDAFDYEHFFLHSAMGTISQQRMKRRGSGATFSSDDSVETTRGPTTAASDLQIATRAMQKRRGSGGSTSTELTFATATEGRVSRRSSLPSMGADGKAQDMEMLSRNEYFDASDAPASDENTISRPTSNMSMAIATPDPTVSNRRPWSAARTPGLHRPSISSFESTGTNRSFPLVNGVNHRAPQAANTGPFAPGNRSSGEDDLRAIASGLLKSTTDVCRDLAADDSVEMHDRDSSLGSSARSSLASAPPKKDSSGPNSPLAMDAIQALLKEDQFLVERLIASLGKSVLGLTEHGRASTESRMYRRRIEAARRCLEGIALE